MFEPTETGPKVRIRAVRIDRFVNANLNQLRPVNGRGREASTYHYLYAVPMHESKRPNNQPPSWQCQVSKPHPNGRQTTDGITTEQDVPTTAIQYRINHH
jgi:hypothetical protein